MYEERLLDKKSVLERFHLTRWQLEWLIRTRQIDGMVRVGRKRIFFDPIELEKWVQRNKIGTANGGAK
ncbi:MAG TPA: hypothetical protein VHT73_10875 [Thermodesulfobacteriota bacterium]|nr:hypothetical protein [Thermodesulfobacteriota bacterium]